MREHPLGVIAHGDCDTVTLPYALGLQPVGESRYLCGGIPVGHALVQVNHVFGITVAGGQQPKVSDTSRSIHVTQQRLPRYVYLTHFKQRAGLGNQLLGGLEIRNTTHEHSYSYTAADRG